MVGIGMSRLIATLVLFSSFAMSSESDPIDLSDLVVRDGLYFEKFKDKPYSGFAKHILEIENPRYRRLDFDVRKQIEDLNLTATSIGEIKIGKREGEWKYYHSSGQLLTHANYVNNQLQGVLQNYYLSGQLYERRVIDLGKLVLWSIYNSNGSLNHHEKFANLKPIDGAQEYYYPNGQLESKHVYSDCCVYNKSYYENGQLESESAYRLSDWKFFGTNRSFYKNGQLKYDQPENKNGEKHGKHRFFYEDGQLQTLAIYENGKQISREDYHPNGHTQYEFVKIFGVDRSLYIEYFPDGAIRVIKQQASEKDDGIYIRIGKDKKIVRYNIYTEGKLDKSIYP